MSLDDIEVVLKWGNSLQVIKEQADIWRLWTFDSHIITWDRNRKNNALELLRRLFKNPVTWLAWPLIVGSFMRFRFL